MDPFRKNCKTVICHRYFAFFLKKFDFLVPKLINRTGRDPNDNGSFFNVFLKKHIILVYFENHLHMSHITRPPT